jgi:RHS repeat-associated protein
MFPFLTTPHPHAFSVRNQGWMQHRVRGVIANNLTPLESRLYAPYGTLQTPYGFTGEPTDGNALLYLRARYYAPSLGVFTALDPLEGIVQRAMSLNGYSWVEGNTINYVDPSGLTCFDLQLGTDIAGICAAGNAPSGQEIIMRGPPGRIYSNGGSTEQELIQPLDKWLSKLVRAVYQFPVSYQD